MSRGNRGDAIFLDDKDREIFIDTLDEACTKTGWLLHAFDSSHRRSSGFALTFGNSSCAFRLVVS